MGIYDRDYYRREGPGLFGAWAEQGRVTAWLIGINIACFILQFATGTSTPFGRTDPITSWFQLDVNKILAGEVWRFLTYAFLHDPDSILHLAINMLVLFSFGRQVEERLGSREYLSFYLLAAVVSGLAFFLAVLAGFHKVPRCVGASGAVVAVLVLAACANPRQVVLFMFFIPMPIWFLVAFLVFMDLIPFLRHDSGTVATSAHLGGAAFAFAYFRLGMRLTGWGLRWPRWAKRSSRPQLRLYREDDDDRPAVPVAPRAAPARQAEDEQLEAQLDDILAKIPRVGMEGLTESERQVLRRASEAAKRRRS